MYRLLVIVALIAAVACSKHKEPPPKPQPPRATKRLPVTTSSPKALAAFRKARRLMENMRIVEAHRQFQKAVEFDPGFVQALAYLGRLTPGAKGKQIVREAMERAKRLPETERLLVRMLMTEKCGDAHESRGVLRALARRAPEDWRVQLLLGSTAYHDRKWDEAIAALRKAIELNPKAGEPYNMLAYALAAKGKFTEAIAAAKRYAAMRPGEPNPHDSIGELYMKAGRLREAEAKFKDALKIYPKFWQAWEATAIVRFARGDWAGGREALKHARETAGWYGAKIKVLRMLSMAEVAQGKDATAKKRMHEVAALMRKHKLDGELAFLPLSYAWLDLQRHRPAAALKAIAKAEAAGKKANLDGKLRSRLAFYVAAARARVYAAMGKLTKAHRALARLAPLAAKEPWNQHLQAGLHFSRGLVAMAAGEGNAAVRNFSQCIPEATECRVHLAAAQAKMGDRAGAAKTRAEILKTVLRSMGYIYYRTKLQREARQASR